MHTHFVHIPTLTATGQAKEWVRYFTSLGDRYEGYQLKNVTPYMHCLVYHVPDMMRRYGSLKKFSCQGKLFSQTPPIDVHYVYTVHVQGSKRTTTKLLGCSLTTFEQFKVSMYVCMYVHDIS